MKDYLPHSDADFLIWFHNFRNKLGSYATQFHIPPEDVNLIQSKGYELEMAVQDANTKKEEAAKSVTHKNEVRSIFINSLRKEITRIKAHKNYTDAIGQELGIVSTSSTVDFANYKAKISAEVTGGLVRIKFVKKSVDGVNIYYRRKGETVWRFLARDTRSPYEHRIQLEDPSKPEHYEYRAFGVVNDVEIGQPSDVVEVVFGV